MWHKDNLYGESAAGYDAFIRRFVPSYDSMQQRVIDALSELYANDDKLNTVIELGVGTGGLAFKLLSDLRVRQYCGYETSPALAGLARARLAMFKADTMVKETDFRKARWPAQVTAIVSTLTFHYLRNEDKEHVFRKCFQALRSGGALVVGDRVISRNTAFGRIYKARMTRFWDSATAHWTAALTSAHKTQDDPNEEPWFLEDQMRLLRDIGFSQVECIWKDFNYCVFCGIRAESDRGNR